MCLWHVELVWECSCGFCKNIKKYYQARRPRPWRRPAPSGARCRAPPGRARRSGAATGPARAGVGPRRAGDLSDRRAASGAPSGGVGRTARRVGGPKLLARVARLALAL